MTKSKEPSIPKTQDIQLAEEVLTEFCASELTMGSVEGSVLEEGGEGQLWYWR